MMNNKKNKRKKLIDQIIKDYYDKKLNFLHLQQKIINFNKKM